jgi:hypothetical protein
MTQGVAALQAPSGITQGYERTHWVKATRWVVPGSRLLRTCFGGRRARTKYVRVVAHAPKRPARRSLPEFQTTGRRLAPLQSGAPRPRHSSI